MTLLVQIKTSQLIPCQLLAITLFLSSFAKVETMDLPSRIQLLKMPWNIFVRVFLSIGSQYLAVLPSIGTLESIPQSLTI